MRLACTLFIFPAMSIFVRSLNFVQTLYRNRFVIGQLVKHDFQCKYLASFMGLTWAFVQPAISIAVIWFAFTYGLKVGKTPSGVPFATWFICGMIPWLFISDSLSNSPHALTQYGYLIKKTAFKVAVIPFIKLFTALTIHLVFVIGLGLFVWASGFSPTIYWLQIPYLIASVFVLLTGFGWLFSALNVFVRDVAQLISAAISILFWVTPIMWPYSELHGPLRYLALLNPFFYITEGYRYAFLAQQWMFLNIEMTVFFWVSTVFIFVSGAFVFRKLTPHFADVL